MQPQERPRPHWPAIAPLTAVGIVISPTGRVDVAWRANESLVSERDDAAQHEEVAPGMREVADQRHQALVPRLLELPEQSDGPPEHQGRSQQALSCTAQSLGKARNGDCGRKEGRKRSAHVAPGVPALENRGRTTLQRPRPPRSRPLNLRSRLQSRGGHDDAGFIGDSAGKFLHELVQQRPADFRNRVGRAELDRSVLDEGHNVVLIGVPRFNEQ
jgi:hypothetical protein